ncbi:MAG: hypothetical protein HY077_13945 [Elusimicrobia bacterium]|nr:hypothetical protein [Elusimicrobiota bacterium]
MSDTPERIRPPSLAPYVIAGIIEVLPVIIWANFKPEFSTFIEISFIATVIGSVIVGAKRVKRYTETPKALIPIAIIALAPLVMGFAQGLNPVGLYLVFIFLVANAPAAILGASIGAFVFKDEE